MKSPVQDANTKPSAELIFEKLCTASFAGLTAAVVGLEPWVLRADARIILACLATSVTVRALTLIGWVSSLGVNLGAYFISVERQVVIRCSGRLSPTLPAVRDV